MQELIKREAKIKELVKETIAKIKGVDARGITLNKSLIIYNEGYEYTTTNCSQFGGTVKPLVIKNKLPEELCVN